MLLGDYSTWELHDSLDGGKIASTMHGPGTNYGNIFKWYIVTFMNKSYTQVVWFSLHSLLYSFGNKGEKNKFGNKDLHGWETKVLSRHVCGPLRILWERQVELQDERVVGVQQGQLWT